MGYACTILADSVSDAGIRLTTFQVTFPRFILAEVNTHRMLSRSSASSRAIPVRARIAAVLEDPFIPESFGRNERGMVARTELGDAETTLARGAWMSALQAAVMSAEQMAAADAHKQLANRVLEPFAWHTAIISATEWDNFFALRTHPAAQPEFQRIAKMMQLAMREHRPRLVGAGGWHLPLVPDGLALWEAGFPPDQLARISCARCARVSYLTHDGVRDPAADLALAARLQSSGHMSPFEHAATPMTTGALVSRAFAGNFRGWVQFRKQLPNEDDFSKMAGADGG